MCCVHGCHAPWAVAAAPARVCGRHKGIEVQLFVRECRMAQTCGLWPSGECTQLVGRVCCSCQTCDNSLPGDLKPTHQGVHTATVGLLSFMAPPPPLTGWLLTCAAASSSWSSGLLTKSAAAHCSAPMIKSPMVRWPVGPPGCIGSLHTADYRGCKQPMQIRYNCAASCGGKCSLTSRMRHPLQSPPHDASVWARLQHTWSTATC
jgi:hypothetical protein